MSHAQIPPARLQQLQTLSHYNEKELVSIGDRFRAISRTEVDLKAIIRKKPAENWMEARVNPRIMIEETLEWRNNGMVNLIARTLAQRELDQQLGLAEFISLIWTLSSRATLEEKENLLWSVLDIDEADSIGQSDVYRMLNAQLGSVLSPDQILRLTRRFFEEIPLIVPDRITKEQFFTLITEHELLSSMTIDLHVPNY